MKAPLHITLVTVFVAVLSMFSQTYAASTAISLDQAAQEAALIASNKPGWSAMLGDGTSMKPHYGKGDVLLIQTSSLNRIRPGMIAVYRDAGGDLVGHTVVDATSRGLRVKGLNNLSADSEWVTRDNYQGVVVGVLHTNGKGTGNGLPLVIGKKH